MPQALVAEKVQSVKNSESGSQVCEWYSQNREAPIRTLAIESAEQRLGGTSRMMGDYHVRFREGLGGWFPWATRRVVLKKPSTTQTPLQLAGYGER